MTTHLSYFLVIFFASAGLGQRISDKATFRLKIKEKASTTALHKRTSTMLRFLTIIHVDIIHIRYTVMFNESTCKHIRSQHLSERLSSDPRSKRKRILNTILRDRSIPSSYQVSTVHSLRDMHRYLPFDYAWAKYSIYTQNIFCFRVTSRILHDTIRGSERSQLDS